MRYELLKNVAVLYDSLHQTPKYTDSGYPMIRVKDLSEGFLDISKAVYVDKNDYDKFSKKYKPSKGDIIFSRVGSYGISSYVDDNIVFCLGQNTVVISTNTIYSRYLYYLMISPIIKNQIEEKVGGSTQKTISLKSIGEFKLPIPSYESQIAIGDFLYRIDKKIELNNQMIATLEELAATLFKRWFVDFEFPDENGNPYKSSGGKMVDSELGEIPEGWEVATIGNLMVNFDRKRIPLSKMERSKRQGEYPYYGAASLMDHVDDYLFDGTYLLLGEDGTVSTSEGYPILQYVYGKFWVNNHAHVLQGKRELGISTEWLKLWFSFQNISSIITGAVQPKISQKNLNSLCAVKPKLQVLNQFNSVISPKYEHIREVESENYNLEKLRDLLLPKLLSGEVEI
ncbi:restriction endonuclease subunit S [Enterococcus pseudoavium]|uniref:Restriction endonuclease subunit S n=1 Tax=Enterococcus pseudoavium TaxID=44007 RepID=A0AAE4I443_9ENTE|nr:restriction endonuclease subunit S [Enterococcus pseudoavium]MDT2738187.1 restriction endonuclease subunit S [Enterococcus pseudoavium]